MFIPAIHAGDVRIIQYSHPSFGEGFMDHIIGYAKVFCGIVFACPDDVGFACRHLVMEEMDILAIS